MSDERDDNAQDTPADMDTLFTKHVDNAQADRDFNANTGRRGIYEADPELGELRTFLVTPRESDPERRAFRLVGQVRGRFGSQEEIARLSVLLSPDARPKKDYETGEETEGKHDAPYVRWLEARHIYKEIYKKPPEELELLQFLRSGQAAFKLAPISGELRVTGIVGRRGR